MGADSFMHMTEAMLGAMSWVCWNQICYYKGFLINFSDYNGDYSASYILKTCQWLNCCVQKSTISLIKTVLAQEIKRKLLSLVAAPEESKTRSSIVAGKCNHCTSNRFGRQRDYNKGNQLPRRLQSLNEAAWTLHTLYIWKPMNGLFS